MDFLSDGFEIYLNFSKNPYLSDFCGDIFFVRSSHENTVIVIPQLRCFQLYSPCGELYWLRQLYLLRK